MKLASAYQPAVLASTLARLAPRRARRGLAALAVALGACAATLPAHAAYPEAGTPIRLVVGFPPGGGADVLARAAAVGMSKALNTNVIVENRPGASGIIATDYVARAAPDGYTLYLGTPGSLTILPFLQKVPYDPATALAPVSVLVTMPNILVTNPASGINSVADLIARAKSGKDVTYASGGNGTIGQMAAEQFNMLAGIKMRHIPYKGTTPALTDVVSGLVDVTFSDPSVRTLTEGGKLKALAVTTAGPSGEFPGVPPIGATVPGYELANWYGVLAPGATPKAVIDTLNHAFAGVMKEPDVIKVLASSGMTATSSTPAQFGELMARERIKWSDLIKKAHISLD
ncbi:Bug family tripartite tricarboxylate transporter substrate binding protein [Achromobacter aloeverae]|uniref:Tripartite tricarboxylate transporter substrate binding protein n=1 Tax=Achromobacter aloeverae TaxID=1750518 RepID=A0A4V1MSU7_9BURK|nr:tripartite tricarboxylate transporter substrate-binding protein [Achromobacter aloeverae]RXN93280.1 tripartite tricarboxylate transporter substrate binding protein [Achromobacter aloeverae]